MMRKNWKRLTAGVLAAAMALLQMPAGMQAQAGTRPDFSSLGAVGDFTEAETAQIAGAIYDGLAAHRTSVTLDGDDMPDIAQSQRSDVVSIYQAVVGGWDAGILAVKNTMWTTVSRKKLGCVGGIQIAYLVTEDYEQTYADTIAQLDAITAGVHSDWTDTEKALYLHEYMAVHYN